MYFYNYFFLILSLFSTSIFVSKFFWLNVCKRYLYVILCFHILPLRILIKLGVDKICKLGSSRKEYQFKFGVIKSIICIIQKTYETTNLQWFYLLHSRIRMFRDKFCFDEMPPPSSYQTRCETYPTLQNFYGNFL